MHWMRPSRQFSFDLWRNAMENPEKPQTVASAALAQPIRHVAAITVLLILTDYEIADTFLLSINTLADWKQQPEWQEASAAFAKAHLAPSFKKSMMKGGFPVKLPVK
jgi:hypothetical protein